MAFWAVYGKSWYRRKDIPNMISLYKKQLYYSLPEEEKIKLKKIKERKKIGKQLMAFRLMVSVINE